MINLLVENDDLILEFKEDEDKELLKQAEEEPINQATTRVFVAFNGMYIGCNRTHSEVIEVPNDVIENKELPEWLQEYYLNNTDYSDVTIINWKVL